MYVWGALLIPLTVAIIGLLLFRKQIVWWEVALLIAISAGIILGVQGCYRVSIAQEPEYWGRYITSVQYYEPWHEYVHATCTETYACGTDSKGNTVYCTRTYDCSHHDYHGPEWRAVDNYEDSYSISESEYRRLVAQFQKTPYFVELHRELRHDIDHCSQDYDGNMYQCDYDDDINKMQPMTTEHSYTNKVIHSRTVFNYPDVVDTLDFLFPKLPVMSGKNGGWFTAEYEYGYQWSAPAIRGHKVPGVEDANHILMKYNGLLGKKKEVRIQMILYHNAPLSYGEQLEWYWKGGNMNEFNVIISVSDSLTVQWARVITWCEAQELRINVRNFLYEQKSFDIIKSALYIGSEVENKWVRKNFDTDFAYLTVDIPLGIDILIYVLVFLTSGGIGLFAIFNGINNGGGIFGQPVYEYSSYYYTPIEKLRQLIQQNKKEKK